MVRATATRRMRRRPAASGASTSSDPPAALQGFSHNSLILIQFFFHVRRNFCVLVMIMHHCVTLDAYALCCKLFAVEFHPLGSNIWQCYLFGVLFLLCGNIVRSLFVW